MTRYPCITALLFTSSLFAQSMEPKFHRDPIGEKAYPSAPRLGAQIDIAPAVALPSVPELIDAVHQWNADRNIPAKNGFVRSTIDPLEVSLNGNAIAKGIASSGRGYVATTAHGVTWSGSIKVERAGELRLHLENVSLSAGATLWVYGNAGPATAFDASLLDDRGGLWTPSVDGDTIHLEVEIPKSGGPASFVIRELLEIVPQTAKPVSDDVSCFVDAACVTTASVSTIDAMKGAVAQLQYVRDGSGYVCTGGLLIDRTETFTPYLLTANHCIADQASASSLQAVWDYKRASCNGTIPPRSSFPKSTGSTLLSTSSASDYTLLRLNSVPGTRWFLGWSPTPPQAGSVLYRVSHPAPDEYGIAMPQAFSSTLADYSSTSCSTRPRPSTLYSAYSQGGTWGGSSGSPIVDSTGHVVGQLTGRCFPSGALECDLRTRNMDGAFSVSYAAMTPWLEATGTPTVCAQNATTLCLSNDRFAVTASWRTADGNTGSGQAVRLTGDTGYFWFFSSSNVEVITKVLNACAAPFNSFWVFAGGMTNVNVTLTVRDVKTGSVKTYTNPQSVAFQPVQDTAAFATCP